MDATAERVSPRGARARQHHHVGCRAKQLTEPSIRQRMPNVRGTSNWLSRPPSDFRGRIASRACPVDLGGCGRCSRQRSGDALLVLEESIVELSATTTVPSTTPAVRLGADPRRQRSAGHYALDDLFQRARFGVSRRKCGGGRPRSTLLSQRRTRRPSWTPTWTPSRSHSTSGPMICRRSSRARCRGARVLGSIRRFRMPRW